MDIKNRIQIFESPDKLSLEAGNFIIELAAESIAARGRFLITLSGGHTPQILYSLLAKREFSNQIQWRNTFVFWGDERCVSLTDEQNNSFMAKSLLLDKVDIPQSNIFPIPVNLEPSGAAKKYERTLQDFFGHSEPVFDLILLGLGENGHTASLFPGSSVITEQNHWVKEVYVEEQQLFRITMTAPLINKARNIVFLVSGKSKADILKTILTGSYQPGEYPAQLIKPETGRLYWFIDKDAAGQNSAAFRNDKLHNI